MKSNNNNNDDDDDDDDNNTAMGSVHARGDTFLTFGLKALTEMNTSRLATAKIPSKLPHKFYTFNLLSTYSQLSITQGNGGRKVTDNPKTWLKQKQSKHGTTWI
jgi:hypothetical protein